MTKRDKWKRRPCVLRYRDWADAARMEAFKQPFHKHRLTRATRITVEAYFHSLKNVGPHLRKPDGDNILKSVCDALFENDEMIYDKRVMKWWTTGESRVEIEWG